MFSGAMAKAAVRSFMDGLTLRSESNRTVGDLLIISGKGLHSERDPVLQNIVLSVLSDEYRVEANVDELNSGRIIVTGEHLRKFIAKNAW